jgi:transcriptional regulator with XRE-family HTH domain
MREKARSDYGLRLFQARTKGGLTQTALAKAAGMSQSAYATAESTGQGSTYTSQLAAACGVSAEWLATGEGEMIPRFSPSLEARQEPGEIEGALRVLAEALKAADTPTRAAVAPLFALLAQEPERLESVASTLMRLIPERNLTARNLQDDQREGKTITALLPSLANKEQQGAKRNPVQSRGRT